MTAKGTRLRLRGSKGLQRVQPDGFTCWRGAERSGQCQVRGPLSGGVRALADLSVRAAPWRILRTARPGRDFGGRPVDSLASEYCRIEYGGYR
jgi:hypothetical protein